jgi:hypothetical protein
MKLGGKPDNESDIFEILEGSIARYQVAKSQVRDNSKSIDEIEAYATAFP